MRIDDNVKAALAAGTCRQANCIAFKTQMDSTGFPGFNGSLPSYTDNQTPLLWFSSDIVFSGLAWKATNDLSSDTQTLTIYFNDSDTIHGLPWPLAIREGIFDHGLLLWYKVYIDATKDSVMPYGSSDILGIYWRDTYIIGEIEVGAGYANITLSSMNSLFSPQFPWKLYSPYCTHALWSIGACHAQQSDFAASGSVEAGSTASIINWSSSATGYTLGAMRFTSGQNNLLWRPISSASASALYLTKPLPFVPSVGDTFVIAPGCDKTMENCRILNPTPTPNSPNTPWVDITMRLRYGGFPFVPPATTTVG